MRWPVQSDDELLSVFWAWHLRLPAGTSGHNLQELVMRLLFSMLLLCLGANLLGCDVTIKEDPPRPADGPSDVDVKVKTPRVDVEIDK
jgi:hypothetical protein